MPLTPFHLGLTILVFSLFLSLDIFALVFGSVIMDIEGIGYYFLSVYPEPHGAMHSLLGAMFVGVFAAVLALGTRAVLSKNFDFVKKKKDSAIILVSGLLGAYMHILLDSIHHSDQNLVWPFAWWNPFLGLTSEFNVYLFSVIALLLGAFVFIMRNYVLEKKKVCI